MERPAKEQVDACMAQVFAEVGELYKGPSAGQFILAAEVHALREELERETLEVERLKEECGETQQHLDIAQADAERLGIELRDAEEGYETLRSALEHISSGDCWNSRDTAKSALSKSRPR